MPKETKDLAASVRKRLRNYANERGEDFNSVLTRYGVERFLYRLSVSALRDRFLLKGAALFSLWFDQPHRPTKDVDLLGYGSTEIPAIEQSIREICVIGSEDGLEFLPETVKGEVIREDLPYQGVRVKFKAKLGNAEIRLQVDIGAGDAVTPAPVEAEFPTILNLPAPKLKVYPKETVVAEKFEAMVRFGLANGRMKDFWDLRYMIAEFEFDGATLQSAIRATFERRETPLPEDLPVALTDQFANDPMVISRWTGFIRRDRIDQFTELGETVEELRNFFEPIITAGARVESLSEKWTKGEWR